MTFSKDMAGYLTWMANALNKRAYERKSLKAKAKNKIIDIRMKFKKPK